MDSFLLLPSFLSSYSFFFFFFATIVSATPYVHPRHLLSRLVFFFSPLNAGSHCIGPLGQKVRCLLSLVLTPLRSCIFCLVVLHFVLLLSYFLFSFLYAETSLLHVTELRKWLARRKPDFSLFSFSYYISHIYRLSCVQRCASYCFFFFAKKSNLIFADIDILRETTRVQL